MVIGEFEYDSGLGRSGLPAFSYILFIFFVIIMTILLMNLLVRQYFMVCVYIVGYGMSCL